MSEECASPRVTLTAERVEGRGLPVVLLHGILDSPRVWEGVLPRLRADGRALLVVDAQALHATGLSPPQEADELAKALAEWAPQGAHVVGHSRGGAVAGWLAVERPELVKSLALVASPPVASEVFRAYFRNMIPTAKSDADRAALERLAVIPDDDWPQHALRRFHGRGLVVEAEDDPLYNPTHTLFWRRFLPFAEFERVPGGHRFFAESEESAAWLAERLLVHLRTADG